LSETQNLQGNIEKAAESSWSYSSVLFAEWQGKNVVALSSDIQSS